MRHWVIAGALIATVGAASSAAQPQPVEIAFSAGRVTLSAANAPVADVLTAWARTGHAEVTGAEYLGARRISIRLTDANEAGALQAIIGSPAWYSTVMRESPEASDSIFRRIVILPAALAAATAAPPEPEKLYSYSQDPDAEMRAAAQLLTLPPPPPDVKRRPANVEPESFYQYDSVPSVATDLPGGSAPPAAPATAKPLPQAAIPEVLYSYTPTPELREPVVASNVIPPTPALVPEAVYTYDPTPAVSAPAQPAELVVPNIPMFEGWIGLRLPGRPIRYVLGS